MDEKDRSRILGPHKKVQQWIVDTRNATRPHFDEVHTILSKVKAILEKQRSLGSNGEKKSSTKMAPHSKM